MSRLSTRSIGGLEPSAQGRACWKPCPCPRGCTLAPVKRRGSIVTGDHIFPMNIMRSFSESSSGDTNEEGGFEVPADNVSTTAAAAVGEECMRMLQMGEDGGVIQHLPDSVIDKYIKKYGTTDASGNSKRLSEAPQKETARLKQFIGNMPEFGLNSFAWRGLLYDCPKSSILLSTLRVSKRRVLQRYEVVSASGEEMIVSLDLRLQETLQPKYRSVRVVEQWFLHGMEGEAVNSDPPEAPTPTCGPEKTAEAQLTYLQQKNVNKVFEFASPANQSSFGNCTDVFKKMLESPQYCHLMGLQSFELLKSVQLQHDKCLLVIGIVSGGNKYVYTWILNRQKDGDRKDCWLCDAVQFLNA